MEAVSLPPLRVGVFADAALQPRWIVEALARAGASGFAEITWSPIPLPIKGTG
jgi:hypothetical protein